MTSTLQRLRNGRGSGLRSVEDDVSRRLDGRQRLDALCESLSDGELTALLMIAAGGASLTDASVACERTRTAIDFRMQNIVRKRAELDESGTVSGVSSDMWSELQKQLDEDDDLAADARYWPTDAELIADAAKPRPEKWCKYCCRMKPIGEFGMRNVSEYNVRCKACGASVQAKRKAER